MLHTWICKPTLEQPALIQKLDENRQLTRWLVQNLNRDPHLPLAAASVDAAMICVSIQYLQRPIAVLREVVRVLRPGGPLPAQKENPPRPHAREAQGGEGYAAAPQARAPSLGWL
jgi:ubiquinone/menaquinone biosynthesis C-methylase UbiE